MLVDEAHRGASARGEAEQIDLAETEPLDQAMGVAYDVLRLQLVVGQASAAPPATAEVEQYDVVIAGQRLEPGQEIPVADVRAAVHHHQRRLLAALPELANEQRHVADIHERITHALRMSGPSDILGRCGSWRRRRGRRPTSR